MQQITITFSDEHNKNCFLGSLPIFEKKGEVYTVNFEELELIKHRNCKYAVGTHNSDARKVTAGELASALRAQGKSLKAIAQILSDNLKIKTSRGKQEFYPQTIKRLLEQA